MKNTDDRREMYIHSQEIDGGAGAVTLSYACPVGQSAKIVFACGFHTCAAPQNGNFLLYEAAVGHELNAPAAVVNTTGRQVLYAVAPMPEPLILVHDMHLTFSVPAVAAGAP